LAIKVLEQQRDRNEIWYCSELLFCTTWLVAGR